MAQATVYPPRPEAVRSATLAAQPSTTTTTPHRTTNEGRQRIRHLSSCPEFTAARTPTGWDYEVPQIATDEPDNVRDGMLPGQPWLQTRIGCSPASQPLDDTEELSPRGNYRDYVDHLVGDGQPNANWTSWCSVTELSTAERSRLPLLAGNRICAGLPGDTAAGLSRDTAAVNQDTQAGPSKFGILSSVHALRPNLEEYFGSPMHLLLGKSIVSLKGQGQNEHDIGGVVTIDPTLAGLDPLTIRSEAMCGRSSGGRNVFPDPLLPNGRHVDGMVCDQVQTKIPSIKDITRVRPLHSKVARNRKSTTQRPMGGDYHLIRGRFYAEDHVCSVIDISPPPKYMAADVERLVGRLHKIGVSTHSEYLVDDMLLADTSVVGIKIPLLWVASYKGVDPWCFGPNVSIPSGFIFVGGDDRLYGWTDPNVTELVDLGDFHELDGALRWAEAFIL
ncbi:hypothetical protein BDD12DRAFT_984687 [Trichophaea hybrida]|nr:hypothetical protein BDD12DRAFT_984687 [Trichophaea hybrida]